MNLSELGWNAHWDGQFQPFRNQGLTPARVAREHTHLYIVCSEAGELTAEVSGKMRHTARSRSDFPAIGDWVAIRPRPDEGRATIHALLPRKSKFSRMAAGAVTEEQVVAANVDTAFLVSGLDGDFNPRRIERYVTIGWDSGASPVVVLNKADLCADIEKVVAEVESIALGVPVLAVSAVSNVGIDALRPHLVPGTTAAFLGSSGVGKSTLINALLGTERQLVRAVREDDSRGRHTTSCRELIPIPGGGLVIDTPGMREILPWSEEDGLGRTFEDIEQLAAQCRFRDCEHESEPGCAVKAALTDGTLDPTRYKGYVKLKRELHHAAMRQDFKLRLAEKARWKKVSMAIRRLDKEK